MSKMRKQPMNLAINTLVKQKIGWVSALAIVVANMVGTGVFTSLGLQVQQVPNTWAILLLWAFGGLTALLGAFAYAELGTHLRRSGGEYHFLSTLYHPFLGYLSGWVSVTVGFAASIALSSMAMGIYLSDLLNINPKVLAVLAILTLSFAHSGNLKRSSRVQIVLTALKILLILVFIVVGWYLPAKTDHWEAHPTQSWEWSPAAFAIALVFVNYSYSGWNSAAYIVEEIKNPVRNLPRALIGGTVLVAILYILLQLSFLRQVPISAMINKVQIGELAANSMFGHQIGNWFSLGIALLLASGLSAMIWVGPRVIQSMGKDHQFWTFWQAENQQGVPVKAIGLLAALSIILCLTGGFEQLLIYSGFVLQLFNALTVAGVFILRTRFKHLKGYRSPLYPALQLIFLAGSAWMLAYLLIDKPLESMLGLANLALGALTFFWGWKRKNATAAPSPGSLN
jgi:basic amino acid/polyamine antiporter, APA family